MRHGGNPKLSAMRVANGEIATQEILQALKAHNGNVTHAAKALHIGKRTLNRWISEDRDLSRALAKIRKET